MYKLCPHWVTGFSDGESSFSLIISKNSEKRTGWGVQPIFSIELHVRDLLLLVRIKAFFGVGIIYIRKSGNNAIYCVQSFKDLTNVIIPYFDKYSLLTQKQADFLLLKSAIVLLNAKEQSTIEGLYKIINIRVSMNKGLSDVLNKTFTKVIPVKRPLIKSEIIPDPNWLVGFMDAEGCFYVKISE